VILGDCMEILKTRPVPMGMADAVMSKKGKDTEKELGYEQNLAVEHLTKFTRLDAKNAEKLMEEINSVLRMGAETLVQIVNVMPKNPDEVRMIFAREKFSLKEDEVAKILEIVKKY
jgi:DNA-directed RNA polymerase subunit F